jgi:hypothetical protein
MAKPKSANSTLVGSVWDPDALVSERPTQMRCGLCHGDNYTHREGCPEEFARVVKPPPPPRYEPLSDLARSTAAAVLRRLARMIEPKPDHERPL